VNILLYSDYQYPAKGSCGSERVVERLARGFIKLGHKVYLSCYPNSTTDIKGLKLVNYTIPDDVDVIHVHGHDLDQEAKYNAFGKPWCSTLHGGGSETDPRWINHPKVICVSKFVSDRLQIPAYVHTCYSPEEFFYQEQKQKYFIYLAGFGWGLQKGIGIFISLARKVRSHEFYICGAGNSGFAEEVKKAIVNDRNVKFVGEVNGQTKAMYLANAKALIYPTQLNDACPSSVIEALACGTPVIGSQYGSMPEIVPEQCGYICKSEADYMKAILDINKIKPTDCRKYAEQNYADTIAAQRHLVYYSNIISKGSTT
jgi:glycosyltransferase involved in cell wall biosynthesis